jgi:hypothetical protein
MPKVTHYAFPRESQMLDYAVNVYKNGEFVVSIRYQGYSGTDVHDEVKWLKNNQYPESEGYEIKW